MHTFKYFIGQGRIPHIQIVQSNDEETSIG
jgi:hypothetical protein